jgi:hypothetical protein
MTEKRTGRWIMRSFGEYNTSKEAMKKWGKKHAKIFSVVTLLLHLNTICISSEELSNLKSETVY